MGISRGSNVHRAGSKHKEKLRKSTTGTKETFVFTVSAYPSGNCALKRMYHDIGSARTVSLPDKLVPLRSVGVMF